MAKRDRCADVLRQKQAKLQELTAVTESALSIVTNTISGLELINKEIEDQVSEITAYTNQMMDVKESLERNQVHNAKIIENFTKLLS